MADKNWIQDVNKGMEERGTKGSFTKQAKRADMSVKDFAEDVKRNPDKFTKRTRQRANLAQTFENMNNKKSEKMATGGKTQGYNDKLNESLGMRTGEGTTTEQSYKDRRDESKGANKNLGIRATSKSRNESKLTENKLLKQSALSPAEYQKAKKLKGFDPKNYMWDPKQDLHLIRKNE
jgi:TFIIF-interacting CTD phosphatase-like protein